MKKFYTSFAAVLAAATISASAMIPEIAGLSNKQPKGANPKITVPAEATVNFLNSLGGQSAAYRVKGKVTADDVAGTKCVLYTSLFNDVETGISSENIEIAKTDDGGIVLKGLLSFEDYTGTSASVSCPNGGPVGTVTDNNLVFPLGQVVGTYTTGGTAYTCYLVSYVYDSSTGKITSLVQTGNLTFAQQANGSFVADQPYAIYINNLGWWTGAETGKIVVPNATVSVPGGSNGAWETAAYAENQVSAEGFDQFFVSTLLQYSGSYGVTFDYEDGVALAYEAITYDETSSSGSPFYLQTLYYGTDGKLSSYEKSVEAIANDDRTVYTLPDYWAHLSDGGYGFGRNNSGTITISESAGVDNILSDVDNSKAPVEYFNLQGIRVSQPAAGTVVIRRQGTNVSKILVK